MAARRDKNSTAADKRRKAEREIQEKMAEATRLLNEARAMADHHKVTLFLNLGDHQTLRYFFDKMKREDLPEKIEHAPHFVWWPGVRKSVFDRTQYGGMWLSSSEFGDC